MLSSPLNLDSVDTKTYHSSRVSEESVNKPRSGKSSEEIAIPTPIKAVFLQGVRDGRVSIVHHHGHSNSNIAKAVHILNDMPYFQEPKNRPLKFWAIRLLEQNPKILDLFCDLPTDPKMMEWLAVEHKAEIQLGQTSTAPLGILAPPPYFPPPPYE